MHIHKEIHLCEADVRQAVLEFVIRNNIEENPTLSKVLVEHVEFLETKEGHTEVSICF